MKTLGVTGGIGAGKSQVCRFLAELGAYVVNADDLAREIMVTEPRVVNSIRKTFGAEAYHTDGSLNRSFLAREAFQSNRHGELNAIVHPEVFAQTNGLIEQARAAGAPLFVKEAALLLINGRPANLEKILWVDAPVENRVNRVVLRDQTTPDLVLARLEKQQKLEDVRHLVDIVMVNDGSISDLKIQVEKLFNDLCSL